MTRAFACAAILLLFGICTNTFSQPYPTRPIRLVVGFAPGGAADTVARTVGAAMSRELGQPVIIENRAGAGSSIAAENVAKSAPDGYSLLIASPSSISVNPALNPKLNYRPQDLLPITKITAAPLLIVVNPTTGITSVKELIAADKKSPGKLNFASSGNGSAPHFGGALFNQVAGSNQLLAIFALVALLVLFLTRHHFDSHTLVGQISLGLIFGGIAGNLIDRFRHGHVVDFIYFYLSRRGGVEVGFPAFNIADSAICAGVALLFLLSWQKDQASASPAKGSAK